MHESEKSERAGRIMGGSKEVEGDGGCKQ